MATLRIEEQTDERVRFTVLDDNGQEIQQSAFPIAPLLEKARRQHKNLEYILAKEVGASRIESPTPVINVRMVEPVTVTPEASVTVETDEPEVMALSMADLEARFERKGHEHALDESYARNPHRHVLDGVEGLREALTALQTQLDDLQALVTPALLSLERKIDHHDHDVPQHPHPSLAAQIDTVREIVDGLEKRPVGVTSLAGYVTEERLLSDMAAVRATLQQLNQLVLNETEARQQAIALLPVPQLDVEGRVKNATDEAAVEAIVRRVLESEPRARYTVRELSRQSVGSKKRFTVEEV